MLINLYSIYDVKAQIYNNIWTANNDNVAIRNFTDLIDDPNSIIHKHHEDFILYCLGIFDDQTGLIDDANFPLQVFDGKTYQFTD
jgi:hypothetical protein